MRADDLADGTLLAVLIEVLTGKSVHGVKKKKKSDAAQNLLGVRNMDALELDKAALEAAGMNLKDISSKDIAERDPIKLAQFFGLIMHRFDPHAGSAHAS